MVETLSNTQPPIFTASKTHKEQQMEKIIVDCSTGEQTVVPLTAEEIAQREADAQAFADAKAQEEADKAAKEAAKADLLAKLGITEDEAKLLLA